MVFGCDFSPISRKKIKDYQYNSVNSFLIKNKGEKTEVQEEKEEEKICFRTGLNNFWVINNIVEFDIEYRRWLIKVRTFKDV
jgi:hypothetical protein